MSTRQLFEVGIVGAYGIEAQQLRDAARAAGLAIRQLEFSAPQARTAIAAHGPGGVRLPLAIVDERYCLQRPTIGEVLACLEVVCGKRETLPPGCLRLAASEP